MLQAYVYKDEDVSRMSDEDAIKIISRVFGAPHLIKTVRHSTDHFIEVVTILGDNTYIINIERSM